MRFVKDIFFLFYCLQLLASFRASEPWMHKCSTGNVPSKSPADFSLDELEHELFQLFLTTRFQTRYMLKHVPPRHFASLSSNFDLMQI